MKHAREYAPGMLVCFGIGICAWYLGRLLPLVGGPVLGILLGMLLGGAVRGRAQFAAGVKFTSKKVLQWAVILLGFGLNLSVILQTGLRSLPVILSTISVSLVVAWLLYRTLGIPPRIATLVGVGSSICGGSAIAATAPVIEADEKEVAQAISVVFFFNVLAAVLFPALGGLLGFSTTSGEGFGIFAGTAVNDTSSVTAAAATWDALYGLGSQTLDLAVTVKLTRTLAIIPITLALALYRARRAAQGAQGGPKISAIFPFFILWFVAASAVTTVAAAMGVPSALFAPLKELSKFLIVMAMAAIGLNTDLVALIKTGGKPLLLGLSCWVSITGVSLLVQRLTGIW